jgi:hypothetical protein
MSFSSEVCLATRPPSEQARAGGGGGAGRRRAGHNRRRGPSSSRGPGRGRVQRECRAEETDLPPTAQRLKDTKETCPVSTG